MCRCSRRLTIQADSPETSLEFQMLKYHFAIGLFIDNTSSINGLNVSYTKYLLIFIKRFQKLFKRFVKLSMIINIIITLKNQIYGQGYLLIEVMIYNASLAEAQQSGLSFVALTTSSWCETIGLPQGLIAQFLLKTIAEVSFNFVSTGLVDPSLPASGVAMERSKVAPGADLGAPQGIRFLLFMNFCKICR